MANIDISDLCPAGADLFLDSESYLNDLTEGEMTNTLGGSFMFCTSKNSECKSFMFCNPRPERKAKGFSDLTQPTPLHHDLT